MQTTAPLNRSQPENASYFHAVAIPKFVALWLGSLGLYGLYWFHAHWQVIRQRQGGDIKPWQRTLLAGSYCEPLLQLFLDAANGTPDIQAFKPRVRAILWLLMTATLFFGPPLSLLCPLAFLPLIAGQRVANQVSAVRTPGADRNSRFRPREWLALLPLALLLLAAALMACGFDSASVPKPGHATP